MACERGIQRPLIAHAEAVPAGPAEEQAETEGPVRGDVRSKVAGSSMIVWRGRPGGQLYLFRHHKPSRFEAQRGGGVAGPDGGSDGGCDENGHSAAESSSVARDFCSWSAT